MTHNWKTVKPTDSKWPSWVSFDKSVKLCNPVNIATVKIYVIYPRNLPLAHYHSIPTFNETSIVLISILMDFYHHGFPYSQTSNEGNYTAMYTYMSDFFLPVWYFWHYLDSCSINSLFLLLLNDPIVWVDQFGCFFCW